MVTINLTKKQALAVMALLGETGVHSVYLNTAEDAFRTVLTPQECEDVLEAVANSGEPVDVRLWDQKINNIVENINAN